jgi:chromosome partitioning protein
VKIVAIANQKGGVGKTTTAVNLSAALAATCRRVLLIDLDAQGNATSCLTIKHQFSANSYTLLMQQNTLSQVIIPTRIPDLFLVPAVPDLAALDIELATQMEKEKRLHYVLKGEERPKIQEGEKQTYDYVFLDCPPGLGLTVLNALVAADAVIVPMQCDFFSLQGLVQLFSTVQRVKKNFNSHLCFCGIVFTMFEPRNNLNLQIAQDVESHFHDLVFKTKIPRNVRVREAPSYGKPVLLYDLQCSSSLAYIDLAKEFLRREKES